MRKGMIASMGVLAALLAAAPARAALVSVVSRNALGANLAVPWTVFGPVGSSLNVFQAAVVGPETVSINSSSGILDISQQGHGFNGDFLPNEVLLNQPNPDDGETIRFIAPAFGVGFNIDPINFVGAFTAYLAAYDSSNAQIGVVSVAGVASASGAGTAPFIGATSFSDPISFITLAMVEPGNPAVSQFTLNGVAVLGNIAINQLSLIAPVPEPAAALVLLSGLLMMVGVRRRGR